MYRMILVDDEDEVRGRISSKISEESGFSIVGTAGNGYDALELIEKHNPHVVLSDIKMPFIDGIELATIIKRDFPTTRVAFITGYDEFDYAREAIELKVSGYLTKPLTQSDISHFLKKLKIELDREFREKYNMEILRQRYEESIPLVIDNYFSSCLVSSRTERGEDIENLRSYGISLDDKPYLLAYIRIEKRENSRDVVEHEKTKLSVRSVGNSVLERHEYEHYSFMFAGGIIFLVKEKGKFFLRDVDSVFFEMVKMTEKFLEVPINIGVSELHREFSQLSLAWEEADKAVGYSHFLHSGRIVYINQLEKKKLKVLTLGESDIKEIEHSLKFGSDRELRQVVESLKKSALRDAKSTANFKPYIIGMMNLIVTFSETAGADLEEVLGEDIMEKMVGFTSLEQLFDWFLSTLLKLRDKNMVSRMSHTQKLLDKAVQYIEGHYTDPAISMERVCEELGISISYMSLLFKKHKETTFVKYLTGVRIARARELLMLTGDRIVEIAGKCGFSDVYYFSHCFKKYMGVSPKKYREEASE